ncbi:hypothetical protein ACF08E_09975 [Streptomyces globisporus]|uniref:hypothetical protein n=1 Tax=Streptomyces globisporus TaxID=1908 RepID=UPI0037018A88
MTHPHDADQVRASLAEIAALLAPAHPDVAEEMLRAHDSPHGYVSAFAGRLDDRRIDEPFDGSDCYPVVGLRAARADELTPLAARAGLPVHHLGADPRRP